MSNYIMYRFFDQDEDLLYIGITGDVWSRFKQHSKTQIWWSEVASATFEHYEHRAALERAEQVAIKNECPRYNVIHNNGFRPDPLTLLLDKVTKMEAKLERISDYASDPVVQFPAFISKSQFLDCTGLTETKFNLLKKLDLLPDGSFKGAQRRWSFDRDKAVEFSSSDVCKMMRLNTLEVCSDILKSYASELKATELRAELRQSDEVA